ncbi:FadR family transcriptional regulator [Streptomyces uncialis]|uniref:FadR/GntR family transcriptional regulator n=1 Tax=Streptomyces uncialis TaxID=1048205 RepID=UPI002E373DA8|nr:FadR/GntR family transcriptional regulator [Streptomyces uncialis]
MAVTDVAIEKIKSMIVTGALRPGDRLPPESELAGALGLSRNSLREAVRALSLIRVLDVRQGDGTYVTGLGPELLLTAVGFAVDLHPAHTAPQFLAVRRILEPAAAALAAARITEPELDALHALLDVPADTVPEAELLARDLEFHRRIARAAGNPVLCALLDALSRTAPRTGPAATGHGVAAHALREHRAILAALRERDAEAARSWVSVHLAPVAQEPGSASVTGSLPGAGVTGR